MTWLGYWTTPPVRSSSCAPTRTTASTAASTATTRPASPPAPSVGGPSGAAPGSADRRAQSARRSRADPDFYRSLSPIAGVRGERDAAERLAEVGRPHRLESIVARCHRRRTVGDLDQLVGVSALITAAADGRRDRPDRHRPVAAHATGYVAQPVGSR